MLETQADDSRPIVSGELTIGDDRSEELLPSSVGITLLRGSLTTSPAALSNLCLSRVSSLAPRRS